MKAPLPKATTSCRHGPALPKLLSSCKIGRRSRSGRSHCGLLADPGREQTPRHGVAVTVTGRPTFGWSAPLTIAALDVCHGFSSGTKASSPLASVSAALASPRSGRTDGLQRRQRVRTALAFMQHAPQPVLGHAVAAMEIPDPMSAVIRCRQPVGMGAGGPAGAVTRPDR
jgi:hypothetical protein